VQLSKEEIKELLSGAKKELKDLGDEEPGEDPRETAKQKRGTSKGAEEEEDIEDLYNLESYDDDVANGDEKEGDGLGGLGLAGLTLYASNEDDPYITLKDVESSDEEDNYRIYPTDSLICVGKAEEDFGVVEVHVYSEKDGHHFCHHDIMLGAFPLTLEWLDYDPDFPDKKGNLLAVGKMDPVVEVWDLDVVDSLEPVFCLGENSTGKKTKKKKKSGKKKKAKETDDEVVAGHFDAVLCISWNKAMRNVLATGSADCEVRVWDLANRTTLLTLPHQDKVQCLQWHPYQPQLLLTGCFDKSVRMFDCVSPKSPKLWKVSGEVEKVVWNHLNPDFFLASCDDGMVFGMSVNDKGVVFQLKAHDQSVSDISLSCYVPGLLATVSSDRNLKLWDIHNNQPAFLFSRDVKMGALYAGKFSCDAAYSIAVGGEKDGLKVIQLEKIDDVAGHFKGRPMITPVLPATDVKSATVKKEPTQSSTEDLQSEDNVAVAMETQEECTGSISSQPVTTTLSTGQVGVAPSRRKHKRKK
jgi:periodic tryptophan protein 1